MLWKPGRSRSIKAKDDDAAATLRSLFPGREVVQIAIENVNRGGGGMNCITQQQPASARFAEACGWAKVMVDTQTATLYAGPRGGHALGSIPRLTGSGRDVYLERLAATRKRVKVRVKGRCSVDGRVGWVDRGDIESAGEKCPSVYSAN